MPPKPLAPKEGMESVRSRLFDGASTLRPLGNCNSKPKGPGNSTITSRMTPNAAAPPNLERRPLPLDIALEIIALCIRDAAYSVDGRKPLLGVLKALCLASREYVEVCQREIFRVVTLQPDVWYDSPVRCVASARGRVMTQRFLDAIRINPALGRLIKTLVYRLNGKDSPEGSTSYHLENTVPALRSMTKVVDVTIEVGGLEIDSVLCATDACAAAVLKLTGCESLRALALRNVELPARNWSLPKGLETLNLLNSAFHIPIDWYAPDCYKDANASVKTPAVSVKTLILRGGDLTIPLGTILCLENVTKIERLPIRFDAVESIELFWHSEIGYEILFRARKLTHLHLRASIESRSEVGQLISYAGVSPISGLHKSCFRTLRTISLELKLCLDQDWVVGRNPQDWVIRNPYCGVFRDGWIFPELTQLEEINIKIDIAISPIIRGRVHERNFGPQWSALDNTIAPSGGGCTPPNLVRLTVFVLLHHMGGSETELVRDFADAFRERVLNEQFKGVERLQQAGLISLMLDVDDWDHRDDLVEEGYIYCDC